MKKISDKLKLLFTSLRFYQLLIIAIIQILVAVETIDSAQGEQIANIISLFLGGVATIGTIDRVVDKSTKK